VWDQLGPPRSITAADAAPVLHREALDHEEHHIMSRTIQPAAALIALLSLFAFAASTAGAVTWHNTGSTAFTATSGPTTISVGSNNLACSGGSAVGTVTAGSFVGAIWPAASGTAVFSPCMFAGQNVVATCTYTVTAVSWTAGPPATTSGNADATCFSVLQSSGTTLCITEGTTPGSFKNPSGITKSSGTLSTSGTGLTITNATPATCPIGTGAAHLSDTTFTVTTANGAGGGPIVTRTA
jgi:hypothetical protein